MSGKTTAGVVLIIAAILLIYSPVFNAGFVWDDKAVYDNPVMVRTDGLARIWFHPRDLIPYEIHYWPVVHSTFWLEYQFHHGNAGGYHITNVILHIINCLLLWCILRKIRLPGAWFAAVIFAVHPVHVESVAWIVERKDLLSFLFYLLAFQAFLRYRRHTRKPILLSALVLFLLALLSKSIAITFPLLLLFWEWTQVERPLWRIPRDHIPFWILAGGYTVLDVTLARTAEVLTFGFSIPEKIIIAGQSIWFYIRQLVFPVEILAVHPRWTIHAGEIIPYIFPVSAIGVLIVLAMLRHRAGKWPIFIAAMYCLTLLPVLGMVTFGFMRYSFVADRFQYLASAFPIAGITALITTAVRHKSPAIRRVISFTAAIIVIFLCVGSFQHAGHYRDKLTLFQHTLTKNPDAYIAHYNVAAERAIEGDHNAAVLHFREVQRIQPGHGDTMLQLANSLMTLGRFAEAERAYRNYLETHPQKVNAYINLGNVVLRQGRMADAIQSYQQALVLDPENSMANNNMGFCLADQNRPAEALICYRKSLKKNPDSIETHINIARILMKQDDRSVAARHYRKTLRLDPNQTEALNNLAWILSTGPDSDPPTAVKLAQRACTVTGWKQAELMDTLVTAYLAAGQHRQAVATAEKALKIAEKAGNKPLIDALKRRMDTMGVDNRSDM